MSDRDDRLPMHQMLEHAREAVESFSAAGPERSCERTVCFSSRWLTSSWSSVEAATRVSPTGRARHPDIPWAKAISTRNFIVHGYDRIDHDVVWDTIAEHFPALVAALERALSSESG